MNNQNPKQETGKWRGMAYFVAGATGLVGAWGTHDAQAQTVTTTTIVQTSPLILTTKNISTSLTKIDLATYIGKPAINLLRNPNLKMVSPYTRKVYNWDQIKDPTIMESEINILVDEIFDGIRANEYDSTVMQNALASIATVDWSWMVLNYDTGGICTGEDQGDNCGGVCGGGCSGSSGTDCGGDCADDPNDDQDQGFFCGSGGCGGGDGWFCGNGCTGIGMVDNLGAMMVDVGDFAGNGCYETWRVDSSKIKTEFTVRAIPVTAKHRFINNFIEHAEGNSHFVMELVKRYQTLIVQKVVNHQH